MNLRYLLFLLNEYPTVVSKWVKYTCSLVRKCQGQKNNQSSIHLIINLKWKLTLILLNVIEMEKISCLLWCTLAEHEQWLIHVHYRYLSYCSLASPTIYYSSLPNILHVCIFQIYDLFAFFLAFLFFEESLSSFLSYLIYLYMSLLHCGFFSCWLMSSHSSFYPTNFPRT